MVEGKETTLKNYMMIRTIFMLMILVWPKLLEGYFRNLFSSQNSLRDAFKEILNSIHITLSPDSIYSLSSPFTEVEIKEVMFSLHLTKSPGPNGLPGKFFTSLWPFIGKVVTYEVLEILNNGANVSY